MADFLKEDGKLTKLKFIAYKDAKFTEKNAAAGEYEVMFNPAAISVKLQVDREEKQGAGSTSSEMKFKMIKPQDYQFEFIIDGTGAVSEEIKQVPEEAEKFLKVVYDYDGTEHKPNYVMILYGAVLLKAVMKSVDVNYTLFKPNGTPLRAKVTIVLTSCIDQSLSEMINHKSSPDLTHKRTLKGRERLISAANNIYKTNNLYVEVARKNKVNNFRAPKPGRTLYLPPIEKQPT